MAAFLETIEDGLIIVPDQLANRGEGDLVRTFVLEERRQLGIRDQEFAQELHEVGSVVGRYLHIRAFASRVQKSDPKQCDLPGLLWRSADCDVRGALGDSARD